MYTLWSNGRLLGHTDLGFRGNTDVAKVGWFHPTEVGERCMHVMTAGSRILLERDGVDRKTLSADMCSAANRIDAMSLELHDDRDMVVNTESVGITDTEILLAFDRLDDALDILHTGSFEEMLEDDDFDAGDLECVDEFEADEKEEWGEPPPLPRYQIIVRMPDSVSAVSSE